MENIPIGKPKSGRVWKSQKNRFSNMVIDKNLKTSWAKKMELKAHKKSIKQLSDQLKEETKQKKQAKRKRTEENKKRRLANERKSEIVQPMRRKAYLGRKGLKKLNFRK